MTKLNTRAILGADHMTHPEAEKWDFDGWYRNTIRELVAHIEKYRAAILEIAEGWEADADMDEEAALNVRPNVANQLEAQAIMARMDAQALRRLVEELS